MDQDLGTVISTLESTAEKYPTLPALRFKADGAWNTIDWQTCRDTVFLVARGLMSVGLETEDGLVILSGNRPEWMMADLAAIATGALPTGLYTTSTADQCGYITRHCGATVAVVENAGFLPQLAGVRGDLKAIVVIEGDTEGEDVLSWDELLERGSGVEEAALRERIDALRPNDPCTLIYTSGTTGPPKGVMLSHTNYLWVTRALVEAFDGNSSFRGISYLPLSHVAEQVISLHLSLVAGSCVSFAESLDALGDNLQEVRPTYFFAVPRVWEKIQARMEAAGASSGGLRRRLVAWARRVGLEGGYAEQRGEAKPFAYTIADRLVFQKVRKRLGFDRTNLFYTGAAPISKATLEFFLSLGIPILEVYGMSECTGPATFSLPDRLRTGAAGVAVPGTELKIADDGEICMRGPHIFLGYHRDEEQTREALNPEGWLHSGDIGIIDDDGFLRVIDRKKELLVTSGGKNVAPVPIEIQLSGVAGVAQAVVVGDSRNYLSALITLDPEQVPDLADRIGSAARDATAAASCATFMAYLEREVERVNESLASYESVKRFVVLPEQLSVEDGTLTPTLKIKRRKVYDHYREQIDGLYAREA
jgi:long-subunit acyl-CoA synthetase (AMP-forming)